MAAALGTTCPTRPSEFGPLGILFRIVGVGALAGAALSSRYRLAPADATHLSTAVSLGADRFITNNQCDFPPAIAEIHITYPHDLPGPAA
jgi:hypothetical protein